jgi:hypothetical protein
MEGVLRLKTYRLCSRRCTASAQSFRQVANHDRVHVNMRSCDAKAKPKEWLPVEPKTFRYHESKTRDFFDPDIFNVPKNRPAPRVGTRCPDGGVGAVAHLEEPRRLSRRPPRLRSCTATCDEPRTMDNHRRIARSTHPPIRSCTRRSGRSFERAWRPRGGLPVSFQGRGRRQSSRVSRCAPRMGTGALTVRFPCRCFQIASTAQARGSSAHIISYKRE